MTIVETDDGISIRVNALGFEENELMVSIQPRSVTILGKSKKQLYVTNPEVGKVGYADVYPGQILQRIDLSTEVSPEGSVVELQAGLMTFELPKAVGKRLKGAAPAA